MTNEVKTIEKRLTKVGNLLETWYSQLLPLLPSNKFEKPTLTMGSPPSYHPFILSYNRHNSLTHPSFSLAGMRLKGHLSIGKKVCVCERVHERENELSDWSTTPKNNNSSSSNNNNNVRSFVLVSISDSNLTKHFGRKLRFPF